MICKEIRPCRKASLQVMQTAFSVDDLQLLAAMDVAGSLSGAAQRLKLDHSTVFRRLGNLERRLGVRLFDRARDGYTPSPAGELAIKTAASILGDLDALERQLAGEDLRPSGVVRVTTTDPIRRSSSRSSRR
jgi:DNA-binding transcriptional LysR family regulator